MVAMKACGGSSVLQSTALRLRLFAICAVRVSCMRILWRQTQATAGGEGKDRVRRACGPWRTFVTYQGRDASSQCLHCLFQFEVLDSVLINSAMTVVGRRVEEACVEAECADSFNASCVFGSYELLQLRQEWCC